MNCEKILKKNLYLKTGILKPRTELPFSLSLFSIPRIHGLSFALNYINENIDEDKIKIHPFVECGLGYGESFSY